MKNGRRQSGFTVVELLVALMVGSIVLAAAASIADAMGSGKQNTERMAHSAAYLAQLQMRLPDLIMRADKIEALAGGVKLTYDGGDTVSLYTDDTKRIVVDENGRMSYFLSDPTQKNVSILMAGVNYVTIKFDITENLTNQTYKMTVTQRGGQ